LHILKLLSIDTFWTNNKIDVLIYLNIDIINIMSNVVDLIGSLRFSCHY